MGRHIAAGIEESGLDVALHNLSREAARRSDPPDASTYDLVGVGSPVHYYRLPSLVTEFLTGLSLPHRDTPTFGFLLHGTYSGWAGRELDRGLRASSDAFLGIHVSRGADRYDGYLRKGYLFSAGHPTEAELSRAHAFGLATGREAGPRAVAGPRTMERDPGWIYRLERLLTSPFLSRHVYSRLFRVDAGRCTSCGACVRRCPSGNVTLDPTGTPVWGRDCLLCLYCQMVCTEEAVSSPVTWPPFDVLVTHNVRKAAADPSLDHVRVVQTQGRTRLL